MNQQNLDHVTSHLQKEAENGIGSKVAQKIKFIRFQEALQVIVKKRLMFTRVDIDKAWERAITAHPEKGIPDESFKRAFFDMLGQP